METNSNTNGGNGFAPSTLSANPMTPSQRILLVAALAALIAAAILSPHATAKILVLIATICYLLLTAYKFFIIGFSARKNSTLSFSDEELHPAAPREWPMYSIIAPMFHEPEVAEQLVRNLSALDYQHDKLDIQLLLEADDTDTIDAVKSLGKLPEFIRATMIPPSQPRTKPKACNIGLEKAKGVYLTIYDAEDRPDPDQIRKAVLAFEKCGRKVACVQSKLSFHNSSQNWLTRFFAADYASWFDLQLPGLAASKALIPLGGTSNHFRTSILRDLGGWDPYNVTEDCDLGVRISRAGYHTAMLDSVTMEEACGNLHFWIRQRTRWIKGYIQTFFVHTRNPLKLAMDLGPTNTIHFAALIGGVIFSSLVNPIFWAMAIAWFTLRSDRLASLFPGAVFAIGTFCLFVGNFVFVYANLLGCFKRRLDRIMLFNLLSPVYWALMSVSGWRAFIQFFTNPFRWEKTQHSGAAPQSQEQPATARPEAAQNGAAQSSPAMAAAKNGDSRKNEGGSRPGSEGLPRTLAGAGVAMQEERGGGAEPGGRCATCKPALTRRIAEALSFCAVFAALLCVAYLRVADVRDPALLSSIAKEALTESTEGRQALIGSAWHGPLPTLFALVCGGGLPGFAILAESLLLALYAYSLARWLTLGETRMLVLSALLMGGLLMCGLPEIYAVAFGSVAILLKLVLKGRCRRRLGGLMILAYLPTAYSALVWVLMNYLVMDDAIFFMRPTINAVEQSSNLASFLRWVPRKGDDAITADLPGQVIESVRDSLPHCTIFVAGYDGIKLRESFPDDFKGKVKPVFDFRIEKLRESYHGQSLYLLVNTRRHLDESIFHQCPHAAEGLLPEGRAIEEAQFGDWRLFWIAPFRK